MAEEVDRLSEAEQCLPARHLGLPGLETPQKFVKSELDYFQEEERARLERSSTMNRHNVALINFRDFSWQGVQQSKEVPKPEISMTMKVEHSTTYLWNNVEWSGSLRWTVIVYGRSSSASTTTRAPP